MLLYRIRFILIFSFLLIGAIIHWKIGIDAAWMSYAAAAILLLTHLLFGSVWVAFRFIQRGQLPEAQQLLNRIRYPQLLVKRNRAYYHFAQGLVALQQERFQEGEVHLQEGLKLGLFRANDRAMAFLNLAHIHYVEKNFGQSQSFLQKARDESPTDLMIKDHLGKLEQALAKNN